ncbi:MAG: FeoB small GTPase domain-containing protein, partial [Phycisphaeraceae bacterium]
MTTIQPNVPNPAASREPRTARVALAGNANSGKTSLFNTITGLRARTANIAGTTTELREGAASLPSGRKAELIDLPGTASLASLRQDERIAVDTILGRGDADAEAPDAIVLVIDATQLQRQLYLAGEVLELGIPTLVCLNMTDLADRAGVKIDRAALSERLGCPVLPTVAHKSSVKKQVLERVEALLEGHEPAYHPAIPLGLQSDSG